MKVFDKETIEGFSYGVDLDIIEKSISELFLILENSMQDFRKSNPFVNENFKILLVNEFYSGAVCPQSNLDVFLIINSPQIEINSIKLSKNWFVNIKNKIIKAYYAQKKVKINKKIKQKYLNDITKKINEDKSKYNINDFNKDILIHISKYIPNTSLVSLKQGIISITGGLFAFKINIYPVIDKFGSFNFYQPNKNKFVNIDFKYRFKNLEHLIEQCGKNVLKLIKIYNSLIYHINNKSNFNEILIESLIYNLPNEIFNKNNIYEIFVFSVNFFLNKNISILKSICDDSILIKEEKLIEDNDINTFLKILSSIIKYS